MTPLQKVAMGLVIVFLQAPFGGYDALPDPLGWALVLAGLVQGRSLLPHARALLVAAAIATAVSVPLVLPELDEWLAPSGQWAVSLPQTVFCLVLCTSLATLVRQAGDREVSRFAVLRVVFAVVLAGPVLVYGGGLDALTTPVAVLAVVANVALVYLTFKVSTRPYTTAAAADA